MPDPYTNPAEKPVNDGGGGSAPQPDAEPTEEQAETQANQEGGSD